MPQFTRSVQTLKQHPMSAGELVILTACDVAYLGYAIRLILSIDSFSPGQHVALHVVNPDASVRSRLERLERSLRSTRLSVSLETSSIESWDLEARKTYYACSRFLRLAELMGEGKSDFLVVDADAVVVSPIDGNFSDKPDPEVCLLRRDQGEEPVPDHLAVAAGTVWLRNLPHVRKFADRLASDLRRSLEGDEAKWFLDQRALTAVLRDPEVRVRAFGIKRKYVDWEFRDDAVIWQGKGARKHTDVRYLLLMALLTDDARAAGRHLQSVVELSRSGSLGDDAFSRRLKTVAARSRGNVVILLPRIDLPWKAEGLANGSAPPIADDALDLRMNWVRFASLLANACEQRGVPVEIMQVPTWEVRRSLVEKLGASLVLVPHRCVHDFEPGETPVMFYMQEYFRWMFVLDPRGWSAAATVYPVTDERMRERKSNGAGAFEHYRERLARGEMPSKFKQPQSRSTPMLLPAERPIGWLGRLLRLRPALDSQQKQTPADRPRHVFFPLQIRYDQSIQFFCDYAFDEVLAAVVAWGERSQVVINLKGHPANPKLMKEYLARYQEGPWLRWRDENVHDLVQDCDATFVVNSGVGFEALLHGKPVVMFGRAEYDCVAIRGRIDDIDAAWQACQASDPQELARRYAQFFDWFADDYAIDMSRPHARDRRLQELAGEIVQMLRPSVVPAEAEVTT